MFGYVVMNKPEIKFKDFDLYRSFYCGLCRELRDRYGVTGQISLTYDMTFVILLLSGLYEPPTRKGTTRCIIHPVRKQPVRKNCDHRVCRRYECFSLHTINVRMTGKTRRSF